MSKIKGFYQNNRIYCILMAISLFCLALIVSAFVVYFVEQTKTDTYGNRLDGIENVQITDTHITSKQFLNTNLKMILPKWKNVQKQ